LKKELKTEKFIFNFFVIKKKTFAREIFIMY